jgi:predicted O-methyltransferase YrrM
MPLARRILARIAQLGRHGGSGQAADGLLDVTGFSEQLDVDSLQVLRAAPCWMTRAERVMLYALAFGLRPRRYLEIGTLYGGSALIVSTALEAAACEGLLVCLDDGAQIGPELWSRMAGRTRLVKGRSPGALPQARTAAGGAFDLVLVDGDHTYAGVRRDMDAVLPYVAPGGHVLCHDAYNDEVARALEEVVAARPEQLLDLGVLTREFTTERTAGGATVRWGGLRLLRVR